MTRFITVTVLTLIIAVGVVVTSFITVNAMTSFIAVSVLTALRRSDAVYGDGIPGNASVDNLMRSSLNDCFPIAKRSVSLPQSVLLLPMQVRPGYRPIRSGTARFGRTLDGPVTGAYIELSDGERRRASCR